MSHPVRVSVKCKHNIEVCSKDEIKINLGRDPIFSDPRADAIVEETMKQHNYGKKTQNNETKFVKTDENTLISWNLTENTISIKADEKKIITLEGEKSQTKDAWYSGSNQALIKKNLEAKATKELQEELKQKAENQRAEVEQIQKDKIKNTLEDKLAETLEESREIVTEIYKNWVKSRAETLGNITSEKISTSEDGNIFELTIEIKDNN